MEKVAMRQGGFDRGSYDVDNPSPLAYNIAPTHIDQAGDFLWEIPNGITETTVSFRVNMCRRSKKMEELGCDGCVHHHIKSRQSCSANRNGVVFLNTVKKLGPCMYQLYDMSAEKNVLVGAHTVWWLRDYWAGVGSKAHMGILIRMY